MPSAKYLSVSERNKIDSLRNDGKSVGFISTVLKRHKSTISRYMKSPTKYGKAIANTGAPIKLTERTKRQIKRQIKRHKMSSRAITAALDGKIGKSTICKFLKSENFYYKKMKKVAKLTTSHKILREKFCLSIINEGKKYVEKIVFSDEKRFKIDGPDGCAYYWHDLSEERKQFSKSHFSPGIMVWGCLFSNGKLVIAVVDGTLNSTRYQNVLNDHLLPKYISSSHVFQQDNAKCHVSKSTMKWLGDHKIKTLNWPALSCDLNIMENVWAILVRKIYQYQQSYESLESLKSAILQAAKEIELPTIQTLYDSFFNRCLKVYKQEGKFL